MATLMSKKEHICKFKSKCCVCGSTILKGDRCFLERTESGWNSYCISCGDKDSPVDCSLDKDSLVAAIAAAREQEEKRAELEKPKTFEEIIKINAKWGSE
ncbi:MAG: hypothetical protein EOL93_01975 [Epsilonproteobacteria bacterium]|nr:hypothetical protein [Campylobacterota bacterium]